MPAQTREITIIRPTPLDRNLSMPKSMSMIGLATSPRQPRSMAGVYGSSVPQACGAARAGATVSKARPMPTITPDVMVDFMERLCVFIALVPTINYLGDMARI